MRRSARAVEKLTGLKFFSALPRDVADALLDHVDDVDVRVPGEGRGKGKKREPE
jgi:hypothetical protein